MSASFLERLFKLCSIKIDSIGTSMSLQQRQTGNNTTQIEGLSLEHAEEVLELISARLVKR